MLYFAGGYPGLSFPPPALPESHHPIPPEPVHLVVEIPMLIITGGTTRQAVVHHRPVVTMQIHPRVLVPMDRGMSERAVITMRTLTRANMERD